MDAISCLAPPPAALLASSFADAAIARALHFSTAITTSLDDSSSSSSSSLSHHHSPLLLSALADLPSPCPYYPPPPPPPGRHKTHRHHHNQALAPAGARAGKRRSRASKRAPTTYISTDPANFRLMVQQITGAQADADGVEVAMLQVHSTGALDAAALLLGNGNPQLMPAGDDDALALRQRQLQLELQQQPCFPTLDSWNVMCETNSGEML